MPWRKWPGLLALLAFLALGTAGAETCLSPFVKRLDRPEKYLYVFCLDAAGKNNDQMIVVDVNLDSDHFGKVIHQLDLGSAGNETHHFGFTDDRTHIWGCSLFSNKIFRIDVASNPAKPKLVKVLDNITEKSGLTGPHSPYALPGRMLISFLGSKDGGLPAGMAEFTNDGKFIRRIDLPKDSPYGYDVAIKPDLNRMVTSSFTPPNNYKKPFAKMDLKNFGNKLVFWDFRERKPIQTLEVGLAPLECRWSLKDKANHGFTNCALDALDLALGRRPGRKIHGPQVLRDRQDPRRPAAIARRSLPLCQLLRLQRNSTVGRERPEEAALDQHDRARRASEHDARYRRRQTHVHHQFAAEHAGPGEHVLDAAGPHRSRRPENGPVLPRGPDQAADRIGTRARYVAVLMIYVDISPRLQERHQGFHEPSHAVAGSFSRRAGGFG